MKNDTKYNDYSCFCGHDGTLTSGTFTGTFMGAFEVTTGAVAAGILSFAGAFGRIVTALATATLATTLSFGEIASTFLAHLAPRPFIRCTCFA